MNCDHLIFAIGAPLIAGAYAVLAYWLFYI